MCAASTAIRAVQRMFSPLFLKHVVPLCVVQLRSVHVSTGLLFRTFICSELKLKPHPLIFRVFLPNGIIHYGFPRSSIYYLKEWSCFQYQCHATTNFWSCFQCQGYKTAQRVSMWFLAWMSVQDFYSGLLFMVNFYFTTTPVDISCFFTKWHYPTRIHS